MSVSFSPDGSTLASALDNRTITLWDISPYIKPQTPAPTPDFDGDETVGFPDFLLFVAHFGTRLGDAGYDTKYDLDSNGAIEFSDFLIFVNHFGSEVPPSIGSSSAQIGVVTK